MFHKTQAQAPKKEQTTSSENNTQNTTATNSGAGWNGVTGTANTNKEGTQSMAQTQEKTTEDQTQTTTQGQTPETNTTSTPAAQPFGGARSTFGGSRYANNFGASNSTAGVSTSEAGRQLVIGEGISMSGEIGACEHLVVEGHVEAALKGAKVLDISETGSFSGSVEIEEATVAGTFDGSITVSGRLTVKSTGKIKGTIAYGELAVEAGANLDGKLGPVKAKKSDDTKTEDKTTAKKSDKTTSNTKTTTKTQDNKSGSELPFASNAAE